MTSPLETKKELTESLFIFFDREFRREWLCVFFSKKWHRARIIWLEFFLDYPKFFFEKMDTLEDQTYIPIPYMELQSTPWKLDMSTLVNE